MKEKREIKIGSKVKFLPTNRTTVLTGALGIVTSLREGEGCSWVEVTKGGAEGYVHVAFTPDEVKVLKY